MWCINLSRLAIMIVWMLTIFNFITIIVLLSFGVKEWNKTADIINPDRWYNNYRYNEIERIDKSINLIWEEFNKKEKK